MERIVRLYQQLKKAALSAFFINNDANIRYLTGYRGEDAYLLVLAEGAAFLITDGRYLEQADKDCHGCSGLKVLEHSPSRNPLDHLIVHQLRERNIGSLAFEKDSLSYALFAKLREKDFMLQETGGLVEDFRRIKDEKEQRCLEKATEIADRAFNKAIDYIKPGITEKQLAARFIFHLLDEGADALSFPLIVAAGENGSLPHAQPSERKLKKGDFITFDFGAVYEGYHSDTTRTVIIGPPDARQKQVYALVKKTQQSTSDLLRPGLLAKEAHFHARDMIKSGGFGQYFNHGLGHGTGLDIHEAPTLNPASDYILEKGNSVTCEPGIYIPGWGGVRIEDSLIITEKGARPLGNITKDLLIL